MWQGPQGDFPKEAQINAVIRDKTFNERETQNSKYNYDGELFFSSELLYNSSSSKSYLENVLKKC